MTTQEMEVARRFGEYRRMHERNQYETFAELQQEIGRTGSRESLYALLNWCEENGFPTVAEWWSGRV